MPPARRFRWFEIGISGVILIAMSLALLVWLPDYRRSDPSIEYDKPFGNIRNGTAFNRSTIAIQGVRRIVAPVTVSDSDERRGSRNPIKVSLRQSATASELEVLLEKKLSFYGHVTEAQDVRTKQGDYKIWVNRSADTLVVAIRPGWDSRIEGGFFVAAFIRVPANVEVVQKPYTDSAYSGWWENDRMNPLAPGWDEVPQQPMPANEFRVATGAL